MSLTLPFFEFQSFNNASDVGESWNASNKIKLLNESSNLGPNSKNDLKPKEGQKKFIKFKNV